ncbi:hypothetical protein B296_00027879 [Ensete ventricosum]|uniref:Uncharacterized protein n=1 Tax=Ensete ventricosum TaxID=4639 RepID=A0A426YPP9_ENSVE|nr:hypothetical protein B296_00027879 [Ensete ventricosum]
MVPQDSTREVSCWNGGARVERKYSSSGRSLTPARRPGRIGFRRDPSEGQVSSVVGFAIPLPLRGARAYIVSIVDHSYLATRLPLWLTLSSYASTTPAVLAVRDASTGRPYDRWGFGLTCAKSATRPLAPPYLRPTSFPRWVGHVGGPFVRRSDDVVARSLCVISFFPHPREDLLEVSDQGAEDEILCLAAGSRHEPGNWNDVGADPTEQELGNWDVARADPTEQELGNWDVTRADPTEQELRNWDVARADPTEQELGNWNVARADPTEQELGNWDVVRADPTEQELGNWDLGFCQG